MELFRGDTFLKQIGTTNYTFRVGDKLHIAIMKNEYSKEYLYEGVIELTEEKDFVDLEIPASKTKEFPVGDLLLEVELTTVDEIVQTNQYKINVRMDGIYERN